MLALIPFLTFLIAFAHAQTSNKAFYYQCRPGVWALTFDDGPSPETERLLGYLDDADIKATFFIQGDKLANPAWAAQTKIAYEKGHQIASHTFSHPSLNKLTVAQIQNQMDTNAKLLKDLLGVTPHYMRPPFGDCNAQCADFMKQNQYAVIQWSVDSNDWQYHKLKAQRPKILENMQKNELTGKPLSTSSGYISLQHDTEFFSVDYVPEIITTIKNQGFTFSTVQECLDNPPYPKYREDVTPPTLPTATPAKATPATPPTPDTPATAKDASEPQSTAPKPQSSGNNTAAVDLASQQTGASSSLVASWTMCAFSVGLCTLLLFPLSPV